MLYTAADTIHQTIGILYELMEKEAAQSCCNYIHNTNSSNEAPNKCTAPVCHRITADDRSKIVDWCYRIIDLCQLDRDTVAMTMNIVDRFMSNPRRLHSSAEISQPFSHHEILHDRNKYQLLALSALYISVKVNELVTLSSGKLAAMSLGMYSKGDIEAMERTILECISWRVCYPTAFQVGSVILELMMTKVQEDDVSAMDVRSWESIHEEVARQTEVAVRNYHLSVQPPSTAALLAIINAIEINRNVNDCTRELLMKVLADILQQVKRLACDV